MSACIYHDAEAVAVCPSCDFAVCQGCLDNGADGMCEECAGARDRQAAAAAVADVERCKYCRIASDEETLLDVDGYCGTCAVLPRCATHDDLIAFDACKSCRSQYCRKCLGFNNVCEACTLKQKAAPPRPKPPTAAGSGTGAIKREGGPTKGGTGAVKKPGTGPIKKGTGPIKGEGPKPKRPRPPAPGEKRPDPRRKKGEPELDEKGRPKKRPPTRGQAAMEAKLQSKMSASSRRQLVATMVVVGAIAFVLLGSVVMRASSAESQSRSIEDQMLVVHAAVVSYYKEYHRWPGDAASVKNQLAKTAPNAANRIRIASAPGPSTVVYQLSGEDGFVVMGADAQGETLKNASGSPKMLDQYFTP